MCVPGIKSRDWGLGQCTGQILTCKMQTAEGDGAQVDIELVHAETALNRALAEFKIGVHLQY